MDEMGFFAIEYQKSMPRWRFINNWKPSGNLYTFVLMNVWWGEGFVGVGILNFALEYNTWHEA